MSKDALPKAGISAGVNLFILVYELRGGGFFFFFRWALYILKPIKLSVKKKFLLREFFDTGV